jgi:O-antigen ligase/polysaccharide polymerase Wzy-like membrane protein
VTIVQVTRDNVAGPPLPDLFLLPATALYALVAIFLIIKTRGTAARYLIFACWFRYSLSSLHKYTYLDAFENIRWVALGSLLSIAIGFLVLDKRRMFSRPLVPVWIICGLMIISAVVNGSFDGTGESILRFLFFAVSAVATWEALETTGPKVFKRLLIVLGVPILYQIVSIALGVVKSGELDGSISYIGGYYHEELFSLILATAFLVAVFAGRIKPAVRIAICVTSFVGVYLANYRTTMLGIAPLGLAALILLAPRGFPDGQRALVKGVIAVMGAILILFGFTRGEERFSDLAALAQGTALIRPPATFTYEEQRVLSARPYIWSTYLYAYEDFPTTQKIIGAGPDSWDGKLDNYAHNTLISYLYELGIAGAAAILFLWVTMFRIALRTSGATRGLLIAGHASFFVLNMGTMPHWQIEGNIFYGLLCGYTIAKARLALAVAQPGPDPVEGPRLHAAAPAPAPAWPIEADDPDRRIHPRSGSEKDFRAAASIRPL